MVAVLNLYVCDSDARDKMLYALGRLLDSLVDVLAIPSSSEGVENTVREELTGKLGNLLKGSADDDDLFASRTVRDLLALYRRSLICSARL